MTDMTKLTHGTLSANVADIPAASLFALAQRGFTHILGNEVASGVTAWKKKLAEDKANPRTPTEAEVDAEMATRRDAKLKAILDGSLGVRVGVARLPTIERIMREVAEERIRAKVAASGGKVAMPKGDTLKALVERLVSVDATIKTEAERRMASATDVTDELDLDAMLADIPVTEPVPTTDEPTHQG